MKIYRVTVHFRNRETDAQQLLVEATDTSSAVQNGLYALIGNHEIASIYVEEENVKLVKAS